MSRDILIGKVGTDRMSERSETKNSWRKMKGEIGLQEKSWLDIKRKGDRKRGVNKLIYI